MFKRKQLSIGALKSMAVDPGIFAKKEEMIEHFKEQTAERFGIRIARYVAKKLKGKKGFSVPLNSYKNIWDLNKKLPIDLIPMYFDIIPIEDFVYGSDMLDALDTNLDVESDRLLDEGGMKPTGFVIRTNDRKLLVFHSETEYTGEQEWNLISTKLSWISLQYVTPMDDFLKAIAGVL